MGNVKPLGFISLLLSEIPTGLVVPDHNKKSPKFSRIDTELYMHPIDLHRHGIRIVKIQTTVLPSLSVNSSTENDPQDIRLIHGSISYRERVRG